MSEPLDSARGALHLKKAICKRKLSPMSKTPKPCIGVCKFKRAGHCIGCSMTKDQKALSKKIKKDKHMEAFVALVVAQQDQMGRYGHWTRAYLKRCDKKGVKPIRLLRERA